MGDKIRIGNLILETMTVEQLKKELQHHTNEEEVSVIFHQNKGNVAGTKVIEPATVVVSVHPKKNPGYGTTLRPAMRGKGIRWMVADRRSKRDKNKITE